MLRRPTAQSLKHSGLFVLALAACGPMFACKDGCGGSSNATPDASASASSSGPVTMGSGSASASASASGRGRGMNAFRGATGPLGMLLRTASNLEGLPAEKKTAVEQIGTDLHKDAAATPDAGASGARAEMKAMHEELIAGVKAGKIDTAKMDAHTAALEKDAKTRREAEAEAMNKLHSTLDAGERTKVVAAIRAQEEKREAHEKSREAEHDAGPARDFNRMKLERYTKDLDLDADQQKKAQALLPKDDPKSVSEMRAKQRKELDAVLAGFEKDTFDAKKLDAADANAKTMRAAQDAELKFMSGFVPILKPAQRDLLAQKLERANMGGDHGMNRRGGLGGPRGGGRGGDREHGRDDEQEQEE